jgi:hypothetical protein
MCSSLTKNSLCATRFPSYSANLIAFTLNSAVWHMSPRYVEKYGQTRHGLEAKLNTGTSIPSSLSLLQVADGNPIFLKDKRSDTANFCNMNGLPCWLAKKYWEKKPSRNAWKIWVRKIHDGENYASKYGNTFLLETFETPPECLLKWVV